MYLTSLQKVQLNKSKRNVSLRNFAHALNKSVSQKCASVCQPFSPVRFCQPKEQGPEYAIQDTDLCKATLRRHNKTTVSNTHYYTHTHTLHLLCLCCIPDWLRCLQISQCMPAVTWPMQESFSCSLLVSLFIFAAFSLSCG